MAKSDTIEGQLADLGLDPANIEQLDPFVRYYGNRSSNGAFDINLTHDVLHVSDFGEFVVVLVETHVWSGGTGIEMSTQVFVIFDGKLVKSGGDIFRDGRDPKKDRLRRAFDEIAEASRDENNFVVRLRNKKGGYEDDFFLPISKARPILRRKN